MDLMFDSINPDAFPVSGFAATCGYVDGRWPSSAALQARFPHLPHLALAVFASDDAYGLDVENGDATPDQAPAWLDRQYARGLSLPVIYCNTATIDAVRAAVGDRPFRWFSADWTDVPHLTDGADATQYANHGPGGENVDQSVISAAFLAALPVPQGARMPDYQAIIDIARVEVGYHEGRNPDGTWNNIQKYSEELPGFLWSDGEPYCDVGVGWVFWKAGQLSALPIESASVRASYDAYVAAGRFTEYPVLGGQVIYGSDFGEHTAICVDFTATTVTVVGFNTNNNGSAQGDGVYELTQSRFNPNLRGYGVPDFADGIIISADPKWNNPAGNGVSVSPLTPPPPPAPTASWSAPDFPGSDHFGPGKVGPWVTFMGQQLQRVGINPYSVGPSDDWGPADGRGYADWQHFCGYTGKDADGIPGPDSWARLVAAPDNATRPPVPDVSLAWLVESLNHDSSPDVPTGGVVDEDHRANALVVEQALRDEGLLDASLVDGSFGTSSQAAYSGWQKRCGYAGRDADGVPGLDSLTRLGQAHGFTVHS